MVHKLGLAPLASRYVLPRLDLEDPDTRQYWQAKDDAHDELERLARSNRPILVGPWHSEVGLEVLYWIPFLRAALSRYGIDPARLHVVSRGGAETWYRGLCASYIDIFELLGVEELKRNVEARWHEQGGQKQFAKGALDELILDRLYQRIDGADVLHPSLMYSLFRQYWLARVPVERILPYLAFAAITPPSRDELAFELPDEYYATKVYFRPTFPDTPANRRLAGELIQALAEELPVVLLNTGIAADDHVDLAVDGERVARPLEGVTPQRNLHAQSVVLGHARAFVGTFGGIVHLANAFGVPAVGLTSPAPRELVLAHSEIARLTAEAANTSLAIADTATLAALRPKDRAR